MNRLQAWFIRRKLLEASGLKGSERKRANAMLKDLFRLILGGKNWATTIAGFLSGILGGAAEGYLDPATGQLNWVAVLIAVAGYAFGRLAKSANVTGGTVPLTVEAEKRATGADALPSDL